MFEKIIESETKKLLELIGTGKDVPVQSVIDNCSLNRSYSVYFQAEMDWKIYEEKKVISNDPANAGLSPLTDIDILLEGLYRTRAKYCAEEMEEVISKAVSSRLNYLCRPCNTLGWFIFRGSSSRTWNEILIRLGAFDEYSNLRGLIIAQCKDDGHGEDGNKLIGRAEFVKYVEMARESAGRDIDQIIIELEPLYEYFEEQGYKEAVPVSALMLYFDDMGDTEKAGLLSKSQEKTISREMLNGIIQHGNGNNIEIEVEETASKDDGIEFAEAELLYAEAGLISEPLANEVETEIDDDDEGVEFVGIADLPAGFLSRVHVLDENAPAPKEPEEWNETAFAELNREFIKLRNRATHNNIILELEEIDLPGKDHKDWGRIDLRGITESVSRLNDLMEIFDNENSNEADTELSSAETKEEEITKKEIR